MKKTPFTEYHIKAGARMLEFAGYNMPIEFSGINHEHNAVRNGVGVFDVSHMGEIWVKGKDATKFLQHITTNNIEALSDNKIQYTLMPNAQGGVIDDVLLYRINSETYLLCTNASNTPKDWKHICEEGKKFGLREGVELYNASDEISQLAIQGPLAMKLVQKICKEQIENMEYYTFKKTEVAGVKDVILSITGYTGAGGCELYFANEDADKIWKALWEAGKEVGLENIGLGARDTLRLEMGFCLYGNDIGATTSPIEAGLGWVTKFIEGKDFIGRAEMERVKANMKRRLIAFEMVERGIPRQGYKIADANGKEIGEVTSGTMSPTLKIGIGMGYVDVDHAKVGTDIAIIIRDKQIAAKQVKPPFVKVV